jgi:hypothetical protein
MDQVLRVLTLYDITAYLLPGLVVVWAFLRFAEFVQGGWSHPWSWKLIVVAYIIGQLLQAVASEQRFQCLLSRKPIQARSLEEVFPGDPKDQKDQEEQEAFRKQVGLAIKDTFCDPPSKQWFFLCESYVRAKKLESFVEIMQARWGLFRGLFLALVTAAVTLVVAAGVAARSRTGGPSRREWRVHWLLFVACAAAAWLSHQRKDDFFRYYSQETYRAFYADYVLSDKHDTRVPCPQPP